VNIMRKIILVRFDYLIFRKRAISECYLEPSKCKNCLIGFKRCDYIVQILRFLDSFNKIFLLRYKLKKEDNREVL